MKIFIKFLILLILTSCLKNKSSSIDLIKVGESKVSEKDFALYLMDEAKNYNSIFLKDPGVVEKIKKKVVLNLIVEEFLLNWGKKNKLLLPMEKVDQIIKDQIKSYPDEQAFKRVYSELKLQNNILRRKTQISWIKEQLLQSFTQSVKFTDKEIKSYYLNNSKDFKIPQTIKLQQIVVKSELEAKRLYDALKKGASFGNLASEYSIGAESDNNGIIGWISRGTLPIFDAVFNFRIKRVISPKKSPYGYHIFRVLERKRGRQLPLNEVKERISKNLKAELAKEEYKSWLEKQIQLVKVEKNEEALRSIKIDVKSDS